MKGVFKKSPFLCERLGIILFSSFFGYKYIVTSMVARLNGG